MRANPLLAQKNEIILTSGGGYIRIGDGTVECSPRQDHRAWRMAEVQRQSISQAMQQWDSADFAVTPEIPGNKLANRKKIKRYRSHGVMAQCGK